ncbi:Cys-tRNA(Pro) deacylase [Lacrimispora sp. NSJ-141]|uniref:Cys-tRNA(Pro)/Cys-tRNA(Cys) deacylase n=1 Tax=Lientehia hominis TaxID=2897778 RepID=A0AAP2RJY4_9FIRM|nr:Cys-tRNA(Pro) deacylase [Lientehia hominis]MCD2493607.1 Cys-tRNA(Pro) deacylase [Lientehia hominis]
MRLLDAAGIAYTSKEYEVDESDLSGGHVAARLGLDKDMVFKTLVARGEKNGIMVFCIPVCEELDLKKAAAASGDKKVEMVRVKEILGLTGYIRGGCSPVGMKKKYPTYIEETAVLFDEIAVSAGIRGCQIFLDPEALIQYTEARVCGLVKE